MYETVESWAEDFVRTEVLAHKLAPPPRPERWAIDPAPLRIAAPGRPPELTVVARAPRSLRRGELRDPQKRARLLHTFWHHELQAAELFAWAVLAFPAAPPAFRAGLLELLDDELRHMALYAERLAALGSAPGAFPVRDWFWMRVPQCSSPLQFVALLGLGLEGGNLDHAERFAEWLDAAGDPASAAVQRRVGREEISHVRFAARWFAHWEGALDFERWQRALVPPLTSRMFRGAQLARTARRAAGLDDAFLDAWQRAWRDEAP
ncbi:MAG: DUF455 family protein [Planctomycetes bacterium]|nr:DUF455 family protein [Planctomycetota bacterium]